MVNGIDLGGADKETAQDKLDKAFRKANGLAEQSDREKETNEFMDFGIKVEVE